MEQEHHKRKGLAKIFWKKRDFNKDFLKLPKGTYSTLIMGSSRTHRGIHPYYFHKRIKQNAFKVAKAKIRIKFNYLFYMDYKKIADIPKVLIYGLDYFMFHLESNEFFLDAVAGTPKTQSAQHFGPLLLLSNKKRIDKFVFDKLEEMNNSWFQSSGREKKFRIIDPFIGYDKPGGTRWLKPITFKKFEYTPYPGKEGSYFTKLLEECKKDGVTVILVFLPDYIGTYLSNFEADKFRRDIMSISRSYTNVFIYDYNQPNKFDLSNQAYFLDGGYGKTNSHLSKSGARIFNRYLIRDIKKHYR
jgi:hypothetical protein